MTKEDLFKSLLKLLPIKVEDKGYRTIVSKKLEDYQKLISQLDIKEQSSDWDVVKARVKQLCDGINRAIEREYGGMRHSAYTVIKNQLDGYKSKRVEIKGLAIEDNIVTEDISSIYYRMRDVKIEDRQGLKRKDLFHIPLDKRGIVKTQRYSVPGYPCLYLARSVYGCWEEMGRPNFGTVMVSKFESQKNFQVLDLRVPSEESWQKDFKKCVLYFPIVISSMVQVKDSKDDYKPEYLIPQLLTEWVISHNKNLKSGSKVIGILYTSAQKNDDFDFPDYSYDNFAIPVLRPLSKKKYCPLLSEFFKMSAPTYYDLEVLKQGMLIDSGKNGLKRDEQKKQNMELSLFGKMEKYLSTADLQSVDCK